MSAKAVRTTVAFVDESQSSRTLDPCTYMLAATVCDGSALGAAREAVSALLLRGQRKVHWRDEGHKRRQEIAEAIAALPMQHLVVVRDGRAGEKPERRRRHCLERLLHELGQVGVATVTFESRGPKDDKRDRDMLDALRARKAVAADLRIEHAAGPSEALLWAADTVCGAVAQSRTGDRAYLETIEANAKLEVISIEWR